MNELKIGGLQYSQNRINIVDKYSVKQFSAVTCEGGVISLCTKQDGFFLALRYTEDLENLKKLLDSLTITKGYDDDQ